jgi:hypothetical protein
MMLYQDVGVNPSLTRCVTIETPIPSAQPVPEYVKICCTCEPRPPSIRGYECAHLLIPFESFIRLLLVKLYHVAR